jgi:hypothetical protein
MTYRIVIGPTAELEIRSDVRRKTEHASRTVAARWYDGLPPVRPSLEPGYDDSRQSAFSWSLCLQREESSHGR